MHSTFEEGLPYPVLTLLVLALFYGIYFGKVLAQKRRGIQTRQIGRRKEPDIHTAEMLMSVATLGVPAAQLLCQRAGRQTGLFWRRTTSCTTQRRKSCM